MSGLIWSALGQSIGNAASTVGNYMARDAEREDRQEERRREREEDARRQAERDALYRRPADQPSAGRSGSSGPRELTDDEQSAMAGMTRPEYDAYWGSVKTGDKSAFKRDTTRYGRDEGTLDGEGDQYGDAVSRKNSTLTEQKVTDYPPGFEAEYQAKVAKLAEIRKISVYNKDYDDVKKGERTGQEIDASTRAEKDPAQAGVIGQAIAAGNGKDIIGGDSNVTRNKFTGATSTTPVGDSQIRENNAQAAKYSKESETAGRAEKNREFQGLQQERLAIDADLERSRKEVQSLRKDVPKGWKESVEEEQAKIRRLEDDKKRVQDRLRNFTESEAERGRANAGGGRGFINPPSAPSAAPRPAGAASGPKNYSNLWK